jgi:hypothetical protein
MSSIFISHSSRDNEAAALLNEWLGRQGHRSVFLDFDPANGIPAGRDWEKELYRQIRTCRGVIALCSAHWVSSRWCFMELTYARALGKQIFPIRVDDSSLEGLVTDAQVVDFRGDRQEALSRLWNGLLAAGIDPVDAFDWDGARSAYPGLLAFQEADAAVFFGRDDEIGEGLDLLNKCHRLGDTHLVIVLGASGSGKSSLARAGLVPRLRRDTTRWLVLDPFRPRDDPEGELASVLGRGFASAGAPRSVDGLRPSPGQETGPAARALDELFLTLRRTVASPDANVLLTIDQFEELLGHPPDHPSTRFARVLGDCLRGGTGVTVLATMRSDLLGHFQQTDAFAGVRYENLSLGPMTPAAMEQAVVRPAELSGITLGPGLVQSLVEDARGQDALPLLAFTLHELTQRYGADGRLDLDEYRLGLGGMQAALAKSAEALIAREALSPPATDDLRRAFLRMVRVTDEGSYSRRVARWADVPGSVRTLLETFVNARLLVSRGQESDAVVEVAHEAIFRSWTRLADWLRDSAVTLRLREQIGSAARSWHEAGRHDDDLWRGGRLVRARELRDKGDVSLEAIERAFVDQSVAADEATAAAEQRRRRRRTLGLAAVASGAVALSIVTGAFAVQARRSERSAQEREREASISAARAKAAQNFAEHQRVRARIPGSEPGSFQAKALEALAPKYLQQSKNDLAEAARLQEALTHWRAREGVAPAPVAATLSLEILRTRRNGSSLLLHYGDPTEPRLMLFDGGDLADYARSLKPRLHALRQQRTASAALPIDLVVSTQTDMTHMGGLLRLLDDLAGSSEAQPLARIQTLWSNAFIPPGAAERRDPVDVQRKVSLIVDAQRLGVPVNRPFTSLVTLPEAGAARVHWNEGLTITVLGPSLEYLRAFAKGWLVDWRRRGGRSGLTDPSEAAPDEPTVDAVVDEVTLETFADPSLELIPSPIEIVRPEVPGGNERSHVNLGSIVLLVEVARKRILLPADSRGDLLISALAQAGYTDARGNVPLDIMAIPHGGSENNVSLEFFQRVTADHYVFQADGTFKNPKPATLKMLFDARRADRRPFTIYFTFPPEELREDYPLDELCRMLARERSAGTPFRFLTPQKGQASMTIQLLRATPELPAGVETECRSAVNGRLPAPGPE